MPDLDPLCVIVSGSLPVTEPPGETEKILDSASLHGVAVTRTGRVKATGSPSVTMLTPEVYDPPAYLDRNELLNIFY